MRRGQVGRALGRAGARDGPGVCEESWEVEREWGVVVKVYLRGNRGKPWVTGRCGNWGDERTRSLGSSVRGSKGGRPET